MEVDLFVILTQNYYTRPNIRENKIITILEGTIILDEKLS